MSEEKKIIVDDDWKAQAKKEKEKLAGKEHADKAPDASADDSATQESMPLPPPTFAVLVNSFAMQAMMSLGVIANPMTGKVEKDLDGAKHYIDLLGMLEEKTKGNLTEDENKMISITLHDLRMAFVDSAK